MRPIADFIMRGRMQATLVVAISAVMPLLFWLGAAAGSLVLLRRGFQDAKSVLALGLLPALAWWLLGSDHDPRALLVLLGSATLAQVLRSSESWIRVLLVSIALGLVYAVVLGAVFRPHIEVMSQGLSKVLPMALGDFYQQMPVEERARLDALMPLLLTGMIAAMLQIVSLSCLILGRYWQAMLYNPGGFGREFRTVRIPRGLALMLLACMVVGPNIGNQLAMLTPLCSVPLAFAGLALIHALVAEKHLARFWLVGLYVTLLVLINLIYPLLVVLAIVDSLIDFRGRLASKDPDNANGEG